MIIGHTTDGNAAEACHDHSEFPRTAKRMNWPAIRRRVKRIWITAGVSLTVVFVLWSAIAFRAAPAARAAEVSDATVRVERLDGERRFTATAPLTETVGLLFFPGGMVDPTAYAPLARAVATAGFPVVLIELPRRGAFGGADHPDLFDRVGRVMRETPGVRRWVVAGHSRGAVVASRVASESPRGLAGVVLIGTTHPRDVDLSRLTVPITKIVASRDGLARPAAVEANRHLLPQATRWVRIEGGNHSQFGWYGFQPGDRFARISPERQRAHMINAVLDALRAAAGAPDPQP
jgi:pimeloyl-ACP methyl ester carboxylesterase